MEGCVALGVRSVVVDSFDVLQKVQHFDDSISAKMTHRDLEIKMLSHQNNLYYTKTWTYFI